MMKVLFSLFLTILLAAACRKEPAESRILMVGDRRVDCVGEGPRKCLLVKEKESDPWQFFYGNIEGFSYEEGYTYRIEVDVYEVPDPPADGSSKRYIFKRLIQKQ